MLENIFNLVVKTALLPTAIIADLVDLEGNHTSNAIESITEEVDEIFE